MMLFKEKELAQGWISAKIIMLVLPAWFKPVFI